jgi:hypothetical protein
VVWQGSAGDRRPYADLVGYWEVDFWFARDSPKIALPDHVLIVIAALNNWQDSIERSFAC